MNPLSSLVFPIFFGFVAGIGHGVISHHHNLPLSLSDQIFEPLNTSLLLDE